MPKFTGSIPDEDRLLGSAEVCEFLGGISIQTLYRWRRKDPAFPKPIGELGGRGSSGPLLWKLLELRAYRDSRPRGAPPTGDRATGAKRRKQPPSDGVDMPVESPV